MWEFRSKTRERKAEDRAGVQNGTNGASVSGDDRARAEQADAACEGSSRYSMVSVPSRHGSGLDVASSQGKFVSVRLTTVRLTRPSNPWIKIGAKARGVIAHGSPGRPPPRPAPRVSIDDPEVAIRGIHGGTIAFLRCLGATLLELLISRVDCSFNVSLLFHRRFREPSISLAHMWTSRECARNAHARSLHAQSPQGRGVSAKRSSPRINESTVFQINITIRIPIQHRVRLTSNARYCQVYLRHFNRRAASMLRV